MICSTFIEDRINPDGGACSRNPLCIDVGPIPLLKGVRRDLIDEDTPDDVRTRKTAKGKTQKLVVRSSLGIHHESLSNHFGSFPTSLISLAVHSTMRTMPIFKE